MSGRDVVATSVRFRFRNPSFLLRAAGELDRLVGLRQSGRGKGVVMKGQRPAHAKNERKYSDAIIAKRYVDLQRLRDEVRRAEISRGVHALSKTTRSAPRSN